MGVSILNIFGLSRSVLALEFELTNEKQRDVMKARDMGFHVVLLITDKA
jgi:hypothetical protein